MKTLVVVFAIAAGLALAGAPASSQEREKPHAKQDHGMMEGMQPGAMMCPMMGMGGMGMTGGMGMMGMMGAQGGDPKAMGRIMQMRGEMMMKMGEVMMKYGRLMHDK